LNTDAGKLAFVKHALSNFADQMSSTRKKQEEPFTGRLQACVPQHVIPSSSARHFDAHVNVLGFDDFAKESELWRATQAHTRIDYPTVVLGEQNYSDSRKHCKSWEMIEIHITLNHPAQWDMIYVQQVQ
jgi:hypothetical protein